MTYATDEGIVVEQADAAAQTISIAPPSGTLVTELHWSPSGLYLLYTATANDGASSLWMVPADGSDGARQISPPDAVSIQAAWQPILVELP